MGILTTLLATLTFATVALCGPNKEVLLPRELDEFATGKKANQQTTKKL